MTWEWAGSGRYHAAREIIIHLRVEHEHSWAELRSRYPGFGKHMWDEVRDECRELETQNKKVRP